LKRILFIPVFLLLLAHFYSCRKDKLLNAPDAVVRFSQDSVLFDTVFTSIGSSTRNIRVINPHSQRIRISDIRLQNADASFFILNVDGSPGRNFSEIEIAANDSLYIFIQVKINPNDANSPLIVSDAIVFTVNGNEQQVALEAWGQDAYYHRPVSAIHFSDGTYLPYLRIDTNNHASVTWKKDKPHVIYGYLVVDSTQKLTIEAGVRVYLNYKAGLWVYRYGELHVQGQKGNEVIFQGARREKDFADEPGQWDRIWINEGSLNNTIDYAIIKNGYVGVQAENLQFDTIGVLKLTNTKIQNMSRWGIYGVGFVIDAGNNVVSNCQEYCLNLLYTNSCQFIHCTFANFWNKEKARDKSTVNLNNYTDTKSFQAYYYFGNCIIDGKLDNEITLDFKNSAANTATVSFRNTWIKTNISTSDTIQFPGVRASATSLEYKDIVNYNFEPAAAESRNREFTHAGAADDMKSYPKDINGTLRRTSGNGGVTVGAYEYP
jgi:hypothetical protein